LDFRHAAADRGLAFDLVSDVGLGQEAVATDCVQQHQDRHQAAERHP